MTSEEHASGNAIAPKRTHTHQTPYAYMLYQIDSACQFGCAMRFICGDGYAILGEKVINIRCASSVREGWCTTKNMPIP